MLMLNIFLVLLSFICIEQAGTICKPDATLFSNITDATPFANITDANITATVINPVLKHHYLLQLDRPSDSNQSSDFLLAGNKSCTHFSKYSLSVHNYNWNISYKFCTFRVKFYVHFRVKPISYVHFRAKPIFFGLLQYKYRLYEHKLHRIGLFHYALNQSLCTTRCILLANYTIDVPIKVTVRTNTDPDNLTTSERTLIKHFLFICVSNSTNCVCNFQPSIACNRYLVHVQYQPTINRTLVTNWDQLHLTTLGCISGVLVLILLLLLSVLLLR